MKLAILYWNMNMKLPLYSSINHLEFSTVSYCVRERVRDSVESYVRYSIEDALSIIVDELLYVSMSTSLNKTLEEYGYTS
jgi:hypothetical protein